MGEKMQFPATVEEFMQQYKIIDTEQIYSNGMELVPIHRMRQWFDHIADAQPATWIPVTERLPQIGRNVLMFSAKGRCAEGEFSGSGWWQFRWGAWISEQEVTHWMPLPDPPGGADG